MAATVELELLTEVRDSLKSLEKFEKQANDSFKSIDKSTKSASKGISAIGKGFAAVGAAAGAIVVAGAAVSKLSGFISDSVDAASRQEDAVNNLNVALARNGQFTAATSRELQRFASQIQRTSKFGDELVLEQLALAQSFGASADQAKEITEASVELAAATGKSLDEATRQVSKTLGGFAGELGEVNPAIKALTSEQLRNGDAARILIEQYGGTAQAQISTFGGAVGQLQNTFGDLQEAIGRLVISNPIVIKGIQSLNKAFENITGQIDDNNSAFSDFVADALTGMLDAFVNIIPILDIFGRAFRVLFNVVQNTLILLKGAVKALVDLAFGDFGGALKQIESFSKSIVDNNKDIEDSFTGRGLLKYTEQLKGFRDELGNSEEVSKKTTEALKKLNEASLNAAKGQQKVLDPQVIAKFEGQLKQLDDALAQSNLNQFQLAERTFQKRLNLIKEAASQRVITEKDAARKIFEIEQDLQRKKTELQKKQNQELAKQAQSGGGTGLIGLSQAGIPEGGEVASILGGVQGILGSINAGAQGAKQFVSQLAGAITDIFLPGIGQVVTQITSILAQDAETLKANIQEFFRALPQIIANVFENIPNVIDTILEELPVVIEKISESLPLLITKLITGLAKVLPELLPTLQRLQIIASIAFVKALIQNAPEIARAFGDELALQAPRFVSKLIESIATGGGGQSPVKTVADTAGLGFIGDIFGFQDGGRIPNLSRFENDGAVIRASAGEQIVDRDLSEELQRFLDGEKQGGREQQVMVNFQVGEEELASTIFSLNKRGFRLA